MKNITKGVKDYYFQCWISYCSYNLQVPKKVWTSKVQEIKRQQHRSASGMSGRVPKGQVTTCPEAHSWDQRGEIVTIMDREARNIKKVRDSDRTWMGRNSNLLLKWAADKQAYYSLLINTPWGPELQIGVLQFGCDSQT